MGRHVALLRGINLGSSRRVAMAELRTALTDVGHEGVRTLLQSGNVVLDSPLRGPKLAARLERELAGAFGMEIAVVVRTRAELAKVVADDPLGDVATEPRFHVVTFLAERPAAAAARELEATDFGDERLAIAGREVHTWHPAGQQSSELARTLARNGLGVTGTARNWNTVLKLLALAEE
jgi:uncharacterized protein (DUF1697 family)